MSWDFKTDPELYEEPARMGGFGDPGTLPLEPDRAGRDSAG